MRVLVRFDVLNWAYHRRAENFRTYAPPEWEVICASDARPRADEQWDAVILLDMQADPTPYLPAKVCKLVGSHTWLFDPDPLDWRTRGVNNNRCRSRAMGSVSSCDAVIVYNRAQQEIFSGFHQRVVLTPYTVDVATFTNPGTRQHEKLKVGWCQQVGGGLNSFKGLTDVLIPLIAKLGESVEWSVMTPDAHTAMPTDDLVQWYHGLDVFLCTSSGEGGPQGPFEAAACGCAVISTDVGQVSDWEALKTAGLRVSTYRNAEEAAGVAEAMAAKIVYLGENRDHLWIVSRVLWQSIHEQYNAVVECPRQLEAIFVQN